MPAGIDPTRASIARAYDAALGGKDNYEIDRELLEQVREVVPEIPLHARSNRQFLIRVVRFLAGHADIAQFIDCGCGLPTAENTHQVAQRLNPEVKVVYVDNDPVVSVHGRALLAENEQTFMVEADVFEPTNVMDSDTVRKHIDFDQPVGLLLVGVWHYYLDDNIPELMQRYIDYLPSGSYVAISHFYDPEDDELTPLARRIEDILMKSPMGGGRFRTRAEIEAMFPGLGLVEPGFCICDEWWPDGPRLRPVSRGERLIAGAVGMKPLA